VEGGGAIVPALNLDVYNLFHKQAKPTKLGELFLKFIWEQFGIASACPSSLTLPWQPLFDRLFFQSFTFPPFH